MMQAECLSNMQCLITGRISQVENKTSDRLRIRRERSFLDMYWIYRSQSWAEMWSQIRSRITHLITPWCRNLGWSRDLTVYAHFPMETFVPRWTTFGIWWARPRTRPRGTRGQGTCSSTSKSISSYRDSLATQVPAPGPRMNLLLSLIAGNIM